jgi:hypothetical protein
LTGVLSNVAPFKFSSPWVGGPCIERPCRNPAAEAKQQVGCETIDLR